MPAGPDQGPNSGRVVPALTRENSRDDNGLATQIRHLRMGRTHGVAMTFLAVTIVAMPPEVHDPLLQVFRVVEHRLEVGALRGKQAGEGLAVGRDPQAIAIAAERLTDGGDETNVAHIIAKTPPPSASSRSLRPVKAATFQ